MSHHLSISEGHHLPVAGSKEEALYAIGARFESSDDIVKAAAKLQKEGFSCYESYTPYPVHGLAQVMRLPKSILSFLVLGGGISAILIALSMELIPTGLIYPLMVDGKPTNFSALPQFIPIVVALTLMISAVTAVTGMILLGGMPLFNNPMFAWDLFERGASRSFFIAVEAHDPKFTTASVTELLHDLGGLDVTAIHQETFKEGPRDLEASDKE